MSNGYYVYVGAAPLAPSPYYVLLATPAADHPECNHSKSMVATVETLSRAGIQFDFLHGFFFSAGSSDLHPGNTNLFGNV